MKIQISSGQGPRECEIAVGKLAHALCQEYPDTKIIEMRGGKDECYSSAILSGPDALGELKGTVQWICQSPLRPNHRRKNWFITVSIVPEANQVETKGEIKFERLHASGPGGQNVNKVETGVRLTHIPTGIVVTCIESRSQYQNKRIAMERLEKKLQELGENAKAKQKDGTWRGHHNLVRGNANRVYEGMDFKRKTT